MTFYAFRLLSPVGQLCWVLGHGTFLAQRHDGVQGVNLYYLDDGHRGFFAEVGVDEADERFVVRRSFVEAGPLGEYVVGLPQGWA